MARTPFILPVLFLGAQAPATVFRLSPACDVPRVAIFDPNTRDCPEIAMSTDSILSLDPSKAQYLTRLFGGLMTADGSGAFYPPPEGPVENMGIDYVLSTSGILSQESGNIKWGAWLQTAHNRKAFASQSVPFMPGQGIAPCRGTLTAISELLPLGDAIDAHEIYQISQGAPYASEPMIRVRFPEPDVLPGDSFPVTLSAEECRLDSRLPGRTLRLVAEGGKVSEDSITLDAEGNGKVWIKAGQKPGILSLRTSLEYVYEPRMDTLTAIGRGVAWIGPPPDHYEVNAWIDIQRTSSADTAYSWSLGPLTRSHRNRLQGSTSGSATIHGWISYSEDDSVMHITTDAHDWVGLATQGWRREYSREETYDVENGVADNGWRIDKLDARASVKDTTVSFQFSFDRRTRKGSMEASIRLSDGTSSYQAMGGEAEISPSGSGIDLYVPEEAGAIRPTDSGFVIEGAWDTTYTETPSGWTDGRIHYTEHRRYGARLKLIDSAKAASRIQAGPNRGAASLRVRHRNGTMEFSIPASFSAGPLDIRVLDVEGKLLQRVSIPKPGAIGRASIRTNPLHPGLHLLRIMDRTGRTATGRFLSHP